MYTTCSICKLSTHMSRGQEHKLGCPVVWEEIFRNVGDWRNAQLAKDMVEEAVQLSTDIRLQEVTK